MHCSTSSSLGRVAVMFMATLALFVSVCIGVPAFENSAILPRADCPPHNYTVAAGDDCQKIALNQAVSTNDIIALNCLNPQCTNLKANSTILLPGCCLTYTVKQGDNCTSIASPTRNLTLADFYAFNPTLHSNCSNLLYNTNVCLTAPQGTPFSLPPCPAQNSTSSTSAGAPQSSLASGTNISCPTNYIYEAKTGDTCMLIAKAKNITVGRFEQINPEVNLGGLNCTNLIPGLEYCVSPI